MHLWNKINQTIGRHSEWSHLGVCWDVSGDASPEIGGIFGNSRGAVETYRIR